MAGQIPSSKEAEGALLGLMIQYPQSIQAANDQGLGPEDFYVEANRTIYQSIMALDKEGKAVDLPALMTRLNDQGYLNSVGGADYLMRLVDLGDSSAKSVQYIDIIKDKSLLRQLIKASEEIRRDAMDRSYEVTSVLDEAASKIRRVTESRQRSEFKSSRALTPEVINYIDSLKALKGRSGVLVNFPALDRKTNGFQKGDLIILAARTSVGKTAFAVNLAVNAAVHDRKTVAFFTIEMSDRQIITRMLAAEGRIRMDLLRTGDLDSESENKLMDAEHDLVDADIYIDDNSLIKVSDISAKCRKLISELKPQGKELGMVIVDYLQLIQASKDRDSRQQDVSEISRSLKQLARELNCPVIALSQLSRDSVKRVDKRPQLSDLRESGAIEQDADIVIFLHNNDDPSKGGESRQITLIFGKHRNGSLGEIPFIFDTATGTFYEQERQEAAQ